MSSDHQESVDAVIVGAGPVGLLLGNYLGAAGLRVVLLEQLPKLIDYPRGVGMDDECLRAFQAAGLAEAVLPHTTPDQWMRFVNGHGRVFASIEPKTDDYGWSRRNAFVQPLVDKVLAAGLERFPNVELRLGATVAGFAEDGQGVSIDAVDEQGKTSSLRARYMVGCDGGRSSVRRALDIPFEGDTDSNRWIVVDIANDPIGRPNAYLHADPARPYVSIALPHGIRRFEFMLFPGEGDEKSNEVPRHILDQMLAKVLPDPSGIDLIRARVYTHNARIARSFRKGRVLIAGDAAHIMPVWQGQGYNSGIRDAANLGWKLACVAKGLCGDGLLDSYESERREHAKAMIDLSVTAGKIFAARNPVAVWARDAFTRIANLYPPVRRYFLEMRFKPMPRYKAGALDYGAAGFSAGSWVGRMFIQPRVATADGQVRRLDDVVGPGFAVIAWGVDPTRWLNEESRRIIGHFGMKIITAVPMTQLAHEAAAYAGATVVGDQQGRLKEWFGKQPDGIVVLRPDRFIAATWVPQQINRGLSRLAASLNMIPAAPADPAPASPVA